MEVKILMAGRLDGLRCRDGSDIDDTDVHEVCIKSVQPTAQIPDFLSPGQVI
ncbi:hypothetical protein CY34DRAFT_801518 [Suillus luteus UH-Slu-Lm8-n1]|uniref:Uncharacterized protein n=1 Tax=Suillus luteus UH-Slu-Lm8-n1 TaxID=930992 RepID=A0A0D0A643_9AGAM|nr:hypothetical protein CY34DRAFT_801518 [Suillus luteus UH-Slu-Lm8-n1]